MHLILTTFIFILISNLTFAQGEKSKLISINFQPIFNGQTLSFSEDEVNSDQETIKIETLKFYLSSFVLLKSGKVVWEESESYHLLEATDPKSLTINLKSSSTLSFDKIQFQLGIDSTTNVSGAMGGDLDPTKGMYWTWNSGYINFKLEGTSPDCPARKNEFQFHLGGYAPPFQTVQLIQLETSNTKEINIKIDISKFLDQIDLSTSYQVMSPGEVAQKLSILASNIFYLNE